MPNRSTLIRVGLFVGLVVLIVAAFVIADSLFGQHGIVVSGRTRGNADAKVTLVEFGDFQWPYCKDFAVDAERRIDEEYVSTGKVKFVYKYYPILDGGGVGESHWAAEAAECANEQGKFWDYHDKLFVKWLGENVGMFQKTNLKKFASDLKLNTAQFNNCLDTDKYASVVQADIDEGTKLSVRGTPTFFANGKPFQIQSLDFEAFKRLIDPLLK
jgi:protein-disulfide isomerase